MTLIGESAGGGSILLHITSPFSSAPNQNHFSQAVIQSPAIAPLPHAKDQEETFEAFLRYANVTSLRDAREIQSEILMEANAMLVGDAFYGNYVFGISLNVQALAPLVTADCHYRPSRRRLVRTCVPRETPPFRSVP